MMSETALLCAGQPHRCTVYSKHLGCLLKTLGSQRTAHDGTGREHVAGVLYQVGEL